MRRAVLSAAALGMAALALAGCGSSAPSAGGPRATALSYLPAGSPLVLTLATDPNGPAYQNAKGFIARVPMPRARWRR